MIYNYSLRSQCFQTHWLPKPPEIDNSPEFAILAALDFTIDLAFYAMAAVYPELVFDDEQKENFSQKASFAHHFVLCANNLQAAIKHYRRASDETNEDRNATDPAPF